MSVGTGGSGYYGQREPSSHCQLKEVVKNDKLTYCNASTAIHANEFLLLSWQSLNQAAQDQTTV